MWRGCFRRVRSAALSERIRYNAGMISQYVGEALHCARYDKLEDGTFCGEVARLRGVIAVGDTLEICRTQLAEVVEEWILVRVARGLSVPALGGVRIQVKKAG